LATKPHIHICKDSGRLIAVALAPDGNGNVTEKKKNGNAAGIQLYAISIRFTCSTLSQTHHKMANK